VKNVNNCAAVSPLGGGGGNMERESVVVKDAIKINQKKNDKKSWGNFKTGK